MWNIQGLYNHYSLVIPKIFRSVYNALWHLCNFKWAKSDVWTMHIFPNLVTYMHTSYKGYKSIASNTIYAYKLQGYKSIASNTIYGYKLQRLQANCKQRNMWPHFRKPTELSHLVFRKIATNFRCDWKTDQIVTLGLFHFIGPASWLHMYSARTQCHYQASLTGLLF